MPVHQGHCGESCSHRDWCYGYRSKASVYLPVLRHVSFAVGPGQTLAIVGPNGSGKTTLVKCLLGLYHGAEGTVAYDGIDVASIDEEDLRRHTTAIFQDFVRYEWTLRDNVAAGSIDRRD
jgi:ABC-type multidrug transport system fused ATPase/permease subunit